MAFISGTLIRLGVIGLGRIHRNFFELHQYCLAITEDREVKDITFHCFGVHRMPSQFQHLELTHQVVKRKKDEKDTELS